jgi:septum formation protein
MKLLLASKSASRHAMLTAANVPFTAVSAPIDEEREKDALRAARVSGADLAAALATAKADSVMQQGLTALILGCDQVLVCDDGSMIDKAKDMGELASQLHRLAGRTHRLFSAAVIVEDWTVKWTAIESARMTMRPLSNTFIADYLAREGEALLGCVGGYRIEGRGAQLFSHVEGNSFVVQGLPLLPLLDYLRTRKVIPT